MRPPVVNIKNRSAVEIPLNIYYLGKNMKPGTNLRDTLLAMELCVAMELCRLGKVFVNLLLRLKDKYRIPR